MVAWAKSYGIDDEMIGFGIYLGYGIYGMYLMILVSSSDMEGLISFLVSEV